MQSINRCRLQHWCNKEILDKFKITASCMCKSINSAVTSNLCLKVHIDMQSAWTDTSYYDYALKYYEFCEKRDIQLKYYIFQFVIKVICTCCCRLLVRINWIENKIWPRSLHNLVISRFSEGIFLNWVCKLLRIFKTASLCESLVRLTIVHAWNQRCQFTVVWADLLPKLLQYVHYWGIKYYSRCNTW